MSENKPIQTQCDATLHSMVGGFLAEIDRLTTELAEARKDTARLDWMADNTACFDRIVHGVEWEPEITPTMRDAIDAEADKEATWLA